MNEEKFNKLSKEEQARLASDFRKTVHEGEIVFINDGNSRSLTEEEAAEQLLRQRDELLKLLGSTAPNEIHNEETKDNYPRKSL